MLEMRLRSFLARFSTSLSRWVKVEHHRLSSAVLRLAGEDVQAIVAQVSQTDLQ